MFKFVIRVFLAFFLLTFISAFAHSEHPAAKSKPVIVSSLDNDPGLQLRGTVEGNQAPSQHITIVLVGDTGFAPHRQRPLPKGVYKHGRWLNWADTTRKIENDIDGDINFANIETVVSDNFKLRPVPKAFNFMTHPRSVEHLVDVGFNLFSMANNHAFDYGTEGVRQSVFHVSSLKGQGLLAHAGIGLNREGALRVPVFDVKNTNFAFAAIGIGASSGGRSRANGHRPGQLSINHSGDHSALMANLSTANADYRILSIHRGRERNVHPSRDEINRIHNNTLDQGNVDLLIGHHAHVARGIEINDGRLVFYGLGNFLHQGTANMSGAGGCRDYSLLAKVHLVSREGQKPELAAVEIIPITATHIQTARMPARQAARRIAILNGLSARLDNASLGAKGIRFQPRTNGSGLYCTSNAQGNLETAGLCAGYEAPSLATERIYQAAARSCGRSLSSPRIAKAKRHKPRRKIRSVSLRKKRKAKAKRKQRRKARRLAKKHRSKRYKNKHRIRKFARKGRISKKRHAKRTPHKRRSIHRKKSARMASLGARKSIYRQQSRRQRKVQRRNSRRIKHRSRRIRARR